MAEPECSIDSDILVDEHEERDGNDKISGYRVGRSSSVVAGCGVHVHVG